MNLKKVNEEEKEVEGSRRNPSAERTVREQDSLRSSLGFEMKSAPEALFMRCTAKHPHAFSTQTYTSPSFALDKSSF